MRTGIYFTLILFLFGSGVYNLISNDGTPSDLPFSLENDSELTILPNSEWSNVMLGEWEFRITYEKELEEFNGTVSYNPDSTFIKKVSYKKDEGSYIEKAGGTVKGKWQVKNNMTWIEEIEYCNIEPEDVLLCVYRFSNSLIFGKQESDTEIYEIKYFNNSKIAFYSQSLVDESRVNYSFTRIKKHIK